MSGYRIYEIGEDARSAQINFRVRPALKARLEKLAKQNRRTLSTYVGKLLDDHVNNTPHIGVEYRKQAKKCCSAFHAEEWDTGD
jgi:hypothetical protein